jgi:transcriptional regulator with XRE-family HTH domain
MRGIQVDAARFRQIRQARGFSQQELAKLSGVSERTVRNVESGQPVRLDFLRYLTMALSVDVLDVVHDREELRLVLREQRHGEQLLAAISEHSAHQDPSSYFDLLAHDVNVFCHGPQGLAMCGEYRGLSGVQSLLEISTTSVAFNSESKILNIRTGGKLVVINGVDCLTAVPTGKLFTTPWMNVYEFEDGHIERIDMWADIDMVQQAFQAG